MSDEKAMKQLALRLAAHLKRRRHPVPFEVLIQVLSALRGFTNWHVFLRRKADPTEESLKLTGDVSYFTRVLRQALEALKTNPSKATAALRRIQKDADALNHEEIRQIAYEGLRLDSKLPQEVVSQIEDALVALKAQERVPPAVVTKFKAHDLLSRRYQAASAAFEAYDFGDTVHLEDTSAWRRDGFEWTTPGDETHCSVYVQDEDPEGMTSDVKLTFIVRFKPDTDEVIEAYARDSHGNNWGTSGIKAVETAAEHECDDCGDLWSLDELKPATDLEARLDYPVGDPRCVLPSGECPACGALCYPVKESTAPKPQKDTSTASDEKAAPSSRKFVYVGIFEHQHGRDTRVFQNEASAYKWRTDLAKEYWDDEFFDEETPSDEEIGEAYFDLMSEGRGRYLESFEVGKVAIED